MTTRRGIVLSLVALMLLLFSYEAFAVTLPAKCATCNVITSDFGLRTLNGKQDNHPGIDINAPVGVDMYATVKGTVVFAGIKKSTGGIVIIQAEDGTFVTIDMHMSKVSVTTGQKIEEGVKIGESGNTGSKTTGPHIHHQEERIEYPDKDVILTYEDVMSHDYTTL